MPKASANLEDFKKGSPEYLEILVKRANRAPISVLKKQLAAIGISASAIAAAGNNRDALARLLVKRKTSLKELGLLGKLGQVTKGKIPGGKLGIASGVLSALFLGSTLSKRNRDTRLAERLEDVPTSSASDILRNIQRQERLAMREGRLAFQDPEAYESLRNIAAGAGTHRALARGEFVIGGAPPSGRVLQSSEVQEILAALTGE